MPPRIQRGPLVGTCCAAVLLGPSLALCGCAHVNSLAPGVALTQQERHEEKKQLSGHSPKFVCETSPGHEMHVKYGPRNAEVFGEVLATRLFWALGFAADRMYPVRVRCHGCPKDPMHSPEMAGRVVVFDAAAIERKLPGRAMETRGDSGWTCSRPSWTASWRPAMPVTG